MGIDILSPWLWVKFYLLIASSSKATSNLLIYNNLKGMNWGLPLAGHKLDELPVNSEFTKNRFQCISRCTKTKGCVSINLGPRIGEEHVCEMLENDRYSMFSNMTVAHGWMYVGIQSKCDKNPCAGNDLCLPDYANDNYYCLALGQEDNSCLHLLRKGLVRSGRYLISHNNARIPVYCDQTTDGGGWLVFQRHYGDFSFMKTWLEYKQGFGDLHSNFWWGNDNIHKLTTSGSYDLRIDLRRDSGVTGYAKYTHFNISSEQDSYRLYLKWMEGNIGDSMYHSKFGYQSVGKPFTTTDRDQDTCPNNCATLRKGGWWYGWCSYADLNSASYLWLKWSASGKINFSEMKIRPA